METIDATIVLVDVGLEVSKWKEEQDCFKKEGRTGGNSGAARTGLQWLVWLSLV